MKKFEKQIDRLHFLSAGYLKPYLNTFIIDLSKKGYTELTIKIYEYSIEHFATWLQKKCIQLENINNKVIDDFAKHRYRCPGSRKINKVSKKYVSRVRRFIFYLYKQGIIAFNVKSTKTLTPPLYLEKFKDSLQCRGLAPKTIEQYQYSIKSLLLPLGDNPKKYNVAIIRHVICDAAKKSSRCVTKKLIKALRAYLRFLTTEGLCCPDLDAAVPIVAEWKLSSLPKYITTNELERIIAACDIHTQQGIRDRAIILLLSRLGLRAGDIINMNIDDIDWNEGTLRVCGKGRRETLLPLTQDVGDALLTYLEKARPPVLIDKLFLCLNAPYRPFPFSNGISSVVSAALFRAGITNPPSRGANLLRHTAATNMLRNGATLETVSAVLRHRSLDMTGYYAKVDVPRLTKIAQPWPEGALC
jgi:site-specific recombinase XerD